MTSSSQVALYQESQLNTSEQVIVLWSRLTCFPREVLSLVCSTSLYESWFRHFLSKALAEPRHRGESPCIPKKSTRELFLFLAQSALSRLPSPIRPVGRAPPCVPSQQPCDDVEPSRHAVGWQQLRLRVYFYCQAGRARDCPVLASALILEKVAAWRRHHVKRHAGRGVIRYNCKYSK